MNLSFILPIWKGFHETFIETSNSSTKSKWTGSHATALKRLEVLTAHMENNILEQ